MFQNDGPATANARVPYVANFTRGTHNVPLAGYQLLGNSGLRTLQMMLVLKWTDTLLTAVQNYLTQFLEHQELVHFTEYWIAS